MMPIDGSFGEGGGAIVRNAVALSAVTQKLCKIINIRANRPNPGLQVQHLVAIEAIQKLCNAKVKGAKLHSTELEFIPQKITEKNLNLKISTAGSVGLVLQSVMIAATSSSGINVEINGGATNGKWAAPVNFIKHVVLPILEKIGYKAEINIEKYGYYPKGGSAINAEINPSVLTPLVLTDPGRLLSVCGISHASLHLEKADVAARQANAAKKIIKEKLGIEPDIDVKYVDALNPGSAIDLWALTSNSILGADALGERRKPAEEVGKEAAYALLEEIKSCAAVDSHAEDQLLPYMALAGGGKIRVPKITSHTRTNIWVIEKFIDVKFSINEMGRTIECRKR